jgi:RNA polymerase sigma-70 factor (ECF subfamily)
MSRILREFWGPLVAYADRLLDDHAAAQDVVQRAMIRLWERDHAIPGGDGLRPFLYHMVRNLVANEWRRSVNHDRRFTSLDAEDEGEVTLRPDVAFDAVDLEAAVLRAIELLPRRRREVVVLSRFHGLTNAQIAEVLGISPQTVANQLVSALRELRTCLADRLGGSSTPILRVVRGDRE